MENHGNLCYTGIIDTFYIPPQKGRNPDMTANESATPAVVLKLQALIPSLTKSEQRVALYIIEHPDQVITLSVAALADAAGVSDPTVIRACKRMGFVCYQDLKVTLAQSIVTPLQNIHEQILPGDDVQKIVNKIFNSTIHTLQYTHDNLLASDVQKAAELLMSARRIFIFGIGASGAIAFDLQHKLLRLGMDACAYIDAHLQAITGAYCTAEDVIVAISHSGSSKIIVDNVRIAKENGAKVISLTSIGQSPLSRMSDIRLFTASEETKYRILAVSSRIAELTIIDAIYTYIAMRCDSAKQMKVEKAMKDLKY